MAEALLIFLESKTELQDPFHLIFHDLTNMNLEERKGREPWPIPNRWTPCFPSAHSGMLEIHVPSSSVLTNGRIYWKGIKERLQSECPNHGLRNGSGCVWSCTTHQFHCWPCRHLLGVVRILTRPGADWGCGFGCQLHLCLQTPRCHCFPLQLLGITAIKANNWLQLSAAKFQLHCCQNFNYHGWAIIFRLVKPQLSCLEFL